MFELARFLISHHDPGNELHPWVLIQNVKYSDQYLAVSEDSTKLITIKSKGTETDDWSKRARFQLLKVKSFIVFESLAYTGCIGVGQEGNVLSPKDVKSDQLSAHFELIEA